MSKNNSQTIITQNIDGIMVVKGFGKLSIDPHATRKVVEVAIQSTPEFLAVKEKQDACNDSLRKAGEESKKMKTAKNKTDKDKAWRARETHFSMATGFEAETRDRLPALKKKQKDLTLEQAIYFEPKLGEYVKTDAEIQALRDKLASVQGSGYVDLDGNILEDNRGAVYCVLKSGSGPVIGWLISQITSIGVKIPASGILYGDLDADQKSAVDLQIEINVAAVMSAGEKIQAKAVATERALNESESYYTRLKISGDTEEDAMTKSQASFQARIDELVLIYG